MSNVRIPVPSTIHFSECHPGEVLFGGSLPHLVPVRRLHRGHQELLRELDNVADHLCRRNLEESHAESLVVPDLTAMGPSVLRNRKPWVVPWVAITPG